MTNINIVHLHSEVTLDYCCSSLLVVVALTEVYCFTILFVYDYTYHDHKVIYSERRPQPRTTVILFFSCIETCPEREAILSFFIRRLSTRSRANVIRRWLLSQTTSGILNYPEMVSQPND